MSRLSAANPKGCLDMPNREAAIKIKGWIEGKERKKTNGVELREKDFRFYRKTVA